MNTRTAPTTTDRDEQREAVDMKLEVIVLPVPVAVAVDDIDASDVFHGVNSVFGSEERDPGADPEHGAYQSFVSFSDPDGNGWLLQEVRTRLPGRVTGAKSSEVDAEWPEWYATYMVAEQTGAELPA